MMAVLSSLVRKHYPNKVTMISQCYSKNFRHVCKPTSNENQQANPLNTCHYNRQCTQKQISPTYAVPALLMGEGAILVNKSLLNKKYHSVTITIKTPINTRTACMGKNSQEGTCFRAAYAWNI